MEAKGINFIREIESHHLYLKRFYTYSNLPLFRSKCHSYSLKCLFIIWLVDYLIIFRLFFLRIGLEVISRSLLFCFIPEHASTFRSIHTTLI
ncbi:MAG: hypothetical protein Pg6B_07640 [Candidatus Azobacteroides pseudotrichonymphae]|nr:MAG: hypothetical protein Pg6B_07640 [Candidatus Azobacteroides pseudotrichonymphae]